MRRNMGRRNNVGNSAGGPLITGHLQDIDMELELLKRKREMIEQQQQLLAMEQQFKSMRHYDSYDQVRYNEPERHGSNRDYSHSYDNGSNNRNQFGRKRQADFQWQYEGSSKRTPSKRKTNSSQFNSMQGPSNTGSVNRYQKPTPGASSRLAPLMSVKTKPFVGKRIANQKPPTKLPQKEFTPTKVSKPKGSPKPNNIASQPLAERNKLVSAAKESELETATDVSRMLLPDRVPSQQVTGRLELALGSIMKNIRDMIGIDSSQATTLRSPQIQRVMKQAVRERIRTVMLGKVVGSLFDILEIYRGEFPVETDIDIVNIGLDAAGVPAAEREDRKKMIEKGTPDECFMLNMTCLIESKLIEMFENLEEMYAEKSTAVNDEGELEQAVKDLKTKSEEHRLHVDSKEYKDFLNIGIKANEVKRYLPRLLKNMLPFIIRLLKLDGVLKTEQAARIMKATQNAESDSNNIEGEPCSETKTTLASKAQSRPSYNLPYYVKIMSRPALPKRKVMQAFLNEFNPKSIKKHRTIHNLLFVGFSEKKDFDTMVAANGTAVGRSVLSVRICTKTGTQESNGQKSENKETDLSMDVNTNAETQGEPNVEGEMITADLDGQITDLLSSIRKSEEDDEKETGAEIADGDKETKAEITDGEKETGTEIPDDEKETRAEINDEKNGTKDKTDDVATENEPDDDQTAKEDEDAQEDEEMDNQTAKEDDNQENTTEETSPDQNTAEVNQASDNSEITNETENKNETSENSENQDTDLLNKADKVGELRNNASGRSTPTRMSARLATVTPSTIVTRRTSRLANN